MKILILVPNFGGGGAEFVAKTWGGWLGDQGHSVTFLASHPLESDAPPEGTKYTGARRSQLGYLLRAIAVHRRDRFDVILALLPFYNLIACLVKLLMPRSLRPVVVVSGRSVELPYRQVHGSRHRTMTMLGRRLYRLANLYIAISHPVAAEAAALFKIPSDRILVVPNPATAKAIGHVRRSPSSEEEGSERSPERLTLVVPGRLVEQKRPTLAIEIAAFLGQRGVNVAVQYFGQGPLEGACRDFARGLAVEARFGGWQKDWFSLAPRHSVVLLTTRAEGFGNVLVEAAAVGLPSVTSSKALGVADAVIPGVTGCLIPGDSLEEFAEGVLEASRLIVTPPEGWLRHFSVANSGRILERALLSALGGASILGTDR